MLYHAAMQTNPTEALRRAGELEWQPPSFEVISLDCEITAYAPDDGDEQPLF